MGSAFGVKRPQGICHHSAASPRHQTSAKEGLSATSSPLEILDRNDWLVWAE